MFGLIAEAPRLQLSSVDCRERVQVTLLEHINGWYCRSLWNSASSSPLLRRYVPPKKTTWFWVCLAFLEIYTRAVLFIRQSMKLSLFCVFTAVSSQFKTNMRLTRDLRAPLRARSKAIVYSCISGWSTAVETKLSLGSSRTRHVPHLSAVDRFVSIFLYTSVLFECITGFFF